MLEIALYGCFLYMQHLVLETNQNYIVSMIKQTLVTLERREWINFHPMLNKHLLLGNSPSDALECFKNCSMLAIWTVSVELISCETCGSSEAILVWTCDGKANNAHVLFDKRSYFLLDDDRKVSICDTILCWVVVSLKAVTSWVAVEADLWVFFVRLRTAMLSLCSHILQCHSIWEINGFLVCIWLCSCKAQQGCGDVNTQSHQDFSPSLVWLCWLLFDNTSAWDHHGSNYRRATILSRLFPALHIIMPC